MANTYPGAPVNVGQYKNITSAATVLVNSGEGTLYSITFNKPVATTTIAIYDGLTAGGTLIGTITIPASPMPVTLNYDVQYIVGLCIVMGTANSDITVSYK